MDYVYSLHDAMMSAWLLEEIYRIMAVLQPKALAETAMPLSLAAK